MMSTTPMRTHVIKTVPGSIDLEGADSLMQDYNLSVIEGLDSTVSFTVEGGSSAISALLKSTARIRVGIDVSDIDAPGEYFMRYTIQLPASSGVTVNNSYRAKTIRLVVDEITSKDVPVSLPETIGTPPSSYLYGVPSVGLKTVQVTGPISILETISTARLLPDADGLTHSQTLACPYELLDESGQAVASPHLSYDPEYVGVSIPVYKYAEVPLEVALRPGTDITADMVKVKIDPATIKIFGSQTAVDAVKSISLGTIDLNGVHDGVQQAMNIPLPTGLQLMEGQPAAATVTLQIDGVSTKTVTTGNVQLTDTSTLQPRFHSALNGETIELTLSGKRSAVTAFDLSKIHVSVIFDSAAYGTGVHLIPAKVTFPRDSGVTIVNEETLKASIAITDATAEQPDPPEQDHTTEDAEEGGDAS